jgi:hypothetical protein
VQKKLLIALRVNIIVLVIVAALTFTLVFLQSFQSGISLLEWAEHDPESDTYFVHPRMVHDPAARRMITREQYLTGRRYGMLIGCFGFFLMPLIACAMAIYIAHGVLKSAEQSPSGNVEDENRPSESGTGRT